jgi:hypothetical protein
MKKRKSWGTAWEFIEAAFWLFIFLILIFMSHPKFQAIFGLVLPGGLEVTRDEEVGDDFWS